MEKKEAIKILKDFHDNSALFSIRTALETLHPELKESEDERIRKEILDCFIAMKQQGCFPSKHKEQYDSWIAWLKKQSEYKSPEEVLKIRQELYQSGYNDGYKHGCEDSKKQGEQKVKEIDEEYKIGKWFTGLIPCWINAPSTLQPEHSNHGKNVVAVHLKGGGYRCCCVDDKKPITFSVAENTPFVEGWHNRESSV